MRIAGASCAYARSLKTVVLTPMPSASASAATEVNQLSLTRTRPANRMSCQAHVSLSLIASRASRGAQTGPIVAVAKAGRSSKRIATVETVDGMVRSLVEGLFGEACGDDNWQAELPVNDAEMRR